MERREKLRDDIREHPRGEFLIKDVLFNERDDSACRVTTVLYVFRSSIFMSSAVNYMLNVAFREDSL